MRIRYFPAKYKHIAELDALNRAALPENYSAEFWAEIIAQHRSFVAIHNGVIIGYIIIGTLDNQLTVVSFAVDNKFRGKGIGTQLLKMGLDTSKKNIYLIVRAGNLIAQKLYHAVGFCHSKHLPNYYTNPDENGIEMVKLNKEVQQSISNYRN